MNFFPWFSLEGLLEVLKSSEQGKIYRIGTTGRDCSEAVPAACGLAVVRV